MKKETNLEHYKKELKEIYGSRYDYPFEMAVLIKANLDENMNYGPGSGNSRYTDDILECVAQSYEESVLDDVEKQYLSNIITPFGDRVKYIYLTQLDGYAYIVICVKSIRRKTGSEAISLPLFEKGTMYKGMETNKHYSLEELGL